MKQIILAILVFISINGYAQQSLKHIRTKSWQTLVYKISATDAEQFIKWDSIPISRFENAAPVLIALADSADTDTLPLGHYVEIW